MKIFQKAFILLLAAGLTLVSCDDFGDLNIDPNNPSEARPDLLLTSALQSVSSLVGSTTGTLYVQYFAETQYTDESLYTSDQFDFNGWYTGPLANLDAIIKNDDATVNYKAVARILRAYYFQFVTERWGMVPYSEALLGAEDFQPAYDSQEAIYKDLINELKEATAQISTNAGVINGDILFNGDYGRWTRFANTVRMTIALRMSDADPAYASTEFASAVNAGLITSDVMYNHLEEDNNASPWYTRFITRTDYAISNTMADAMKGKSDMRLLKYADPAPNFDNGNGISESLDEIKGMIYGVNGSIAGSIENADVSFPGAAIRSQGSDLPVYTVAQVHFSKAEGIERGWISGSAAAEYAAGVAASWAQWGAGDAAAYLAQPEVAYSSANWQEKIGYEKWVATFPQGYEAWHEWRRLDQPVLTPAVDAVNNSKQIPVRQAYPATEPNINKENYEAAVAAQGADITDTKLWFDKN